MKLHFSKMNGAGNDFVLADNRTQALSLRAEQVALICDRRHGVGADGLILVEKATGADFYMHFFNSDGTEAEMCGNGARCAAAFAVSQGLGVEGKGETTVRFMTDSGRIAARIRGENVRMEMMDARAMRLDVPVRVAQVPGNIHFMIVGTRHVIVPVEDASDLTYDYIMKLGRSLRDDPAFGPTGANVNFVSVDPAGQIHIRTYEKGVEAETHACGTGSVAAAVLFAHLGEGASRRTVVQSGGEELAVSFEVSPDGARNVTLSGPVALNFTGTLNY
ncbi:MAG: diaminopimelate epimerase [bacterium]|nr:diaminopimelate epimerase [bacterium]